MAVGMKQHAIVHSVTTAVRSPHDVMVMPSRERGDLLPTDDTETILGFPELQQGPTALELGLYLHTQSVFEVFLPARVVRIGLCFQLGVAPNRHLGRFEQ